MQADPFANVLSCRDDDHNRFQKVVAINPRPM